MLEKIVESPKKSKVRKLEQNFKSDYPGEVFHADIKYLCFENSWWYLHAILETYANQVVAWSLSKDRAANSTIALFYEAVKKMGATPRIFHSDCGVEYANLKII